MFREVSTSYCSAPNANDRKTPERKFDHPLTVLSGNLGKLNYFPSLKKNIECDCIAATIFSMVGVFRSLQLRTRLVSFSLVGSRCAETPSYITRPKFEKRELQRFRCSNFRILELMVIYTNFKNREKLSESKWGFFSILDLNIMHSMQESRKVSRFFNFTLILKIYINSWKLYVNSSKLFINSWNNDF